MKQYLKDDPKDRRYSFYCPACKIWHSFNHTWCVWIAPITGLPTVTPSIKVTTHDDKVCHCFITQGTIEYLSDCTHELKGQIIPMEPINGTGQ